MLLFDLIRMQGSIYLRPSFTGNCSRTYANKCFFSSSSSLNLILFSSSRCLECRLRTPAGREKAAALQQVARQSPGLCCEVSWPCVSPLLCFPVLCWVLCVCYRPRGLGLARTAEEFKSSPPIHVFLCTRVVLAVKWRKSLQLWVNSGRTLDQFRLSIEENRIDHRVNIWY